MNRVFVASGEVDGLWIVRISGPWGVDVMGPIAAQNYADDMEHVHPDMAPVAAMIRKMARRCAAKGLFRSDA